jgi:hypothetical protein
MLADNTNKDDTFIGIASPMTHILQATNAEDQYTYKELQFNPRNNDSCYVIFLVCHRGRPNMLEQSLARLSLPPCMMLKAEKVVILNTCSIVKRLRNDEVRLPDEEAENS